MEQDEAQIRSLVEDWATAVRTQDMQGVLAHHSRDIVMFDVPEPLQSIGIDAYRKTWELFFAHNRGGPGSFDVTELNVVVGGDVAWCHALLKIFGATARLTIGLRRESGRWLIAHEHHSYPFELDAS